MTGFLPFLQLLQNTLQPFRKHRIEDYLSGIRIISNIQFKSCHVFLISPKVTFGSVRRKKQTNILDTFDIKSIIEGLNLTYYFCIVLSLLPTQEICWIFFGQQSRIWICQLIFKNIQHYLLCYTVTLCLEWGSMRKYMVNTLLWCLPILTQIHSSL